MAFDALLGAGWKVFNILNAQRNETQNNVRRSTRDLLVGKPGPRIQRMFHGEANGSGAVRPARPAR